TLVSAVLPHASTLIVSGADTGSPGIIQCARSINPTAHIFVRSAYLRDVPPLRKAGAEQVFAGEGEVALAMTEAVLRRLGATPDQIDRARAPVRAALMPNYMVLSASRALSPLNRSRLAFTYRLTSPGSVHASWRSAQPIALRMKNSLSPRFGSMQSYSSVKSVSRLNPSWQRIAARRFHIFWSRRARRISFDIRAGSVRR